MRGPPPPVRPVVDLRDPDPAYWLLVIGGMAVVIVSFGLAYEVDREAREYERSYYPATGGFGIGVAICNGCLVGIGLVVLVLVVSYSSCHRPLPP